MAAKKKPRKLCGDSGQLTAKGVPCTNPVKRGTDKCGTHSSPNAGRPRKTPSQVAYVDKENKPVTYHQGIVSRIGIGVPLVFIARGVGIHDSTIRGWLDEGEADIQHDRLTEFSEFSAAYRRAEGDAITEALAGIRKAGRDGQWQAFKWYLGCVLPQQFGAQATIHHDGQVSLVEQHSDELVGLLSDFVMRLNLDDDTMERVPDAIEAVFGKAEHQPD